MKMEADIRAANIELDSMGMMIENKRGKPIQNPFLSVIDTLERRQLAVIRSMSLNQTISDPRTINGSAKVEGESRVALKDVGVEGLIAQPAHWLYALGASTHPPAFSSQVYPVWHDIASKFALLCSEQFPANTEDVDNIRANTVAVTAFISILLIDYRANLGSRKQK